MPDAAGNMVDDPRLGAGWFGTAKVPTLAFIGQFNRWAAEPRSDMDKNVEPGKYWPSKANTNPFIYKLGLWFASIPLSTVAAERAIGLMREIETPKRNRMKEPQWHAESFLRYNKWLTQQEFDDVREHVQKTEAAIRAGNRGVVPGAAPIAVAVAPF